MNVADVKRLRKLRQTEDEHVLKGAIYRQRLRAQFEKIHGGAPAWAAAAASHDGGDEDEDGVTLLTRQSKPLLQGNDRRLAPSVLDVTRSKDANQAGVSQVSAGGVAPEVSLVSTMVSWCEGGVGGGAVA
jgi:hypothetical protein